MSCRVDRPDFSTKLVMITDDNTGSILLPLSQNGLRCLLLTLGLVVEVSDSLLAY